MGSRTRIKVNFKRTDIYHLNPVDIIIDEKLAALNPRVIFNDKMEEMIDSIFLHGVKQPITVNFNKEGKPVLIHGYRRMYAVQSILNNKKGEIKSVPATIVRSTISQEDILLEHFVNNECSPLRPIEEAKGFRQFKNWGWSDNDIAKRIGKSIQFIKERLKLLDGNKKLQEAVNENKLPMAIAKGIIEKSNGDIELEKELTDKATSGKAGKKEVRKIINTADKPSEIKTLVATCKTFIADMEVDGPDKYYKYKLDVKGMYNFQKLITLIEKEF